MPASRGWLRSTTRIVPELSAFKNPFRTFSLMNPPAGPTKSDRKSKPPTHYPLFPDCLAVIRLRKARKKNFEASDEVFTTISALKPQWLAGRLITSREAGTDAQRGGGRGGGPGRGTATC